MRAMFVAAAFAALGLAGCIDDGAVPDEAPSSLAPLGLRYVELKAIDEDLVPAVTFDWGIEVTKKAPCFDGCSASFYLKETVEDGWLEARIMWDGTRASGLDVSLTGPKDGRGMQRGFDTARDQVWAPPVGLYTLTVTGLGDFSGSIQLRAKGITQPLSADAQPEYPGHRLPNLVTLAPNQVAVGQCLPEERAEQGAQRCLRLGNAVANMGNGPLEVHLDYPNGVLSVAQVGRFVQRLYGDDGHRDIAVGGAQFHPTHGHFHYAGLAEFRLYKHDPETGLRGEEVGRHMKQGFCFLDWGPMNDPEVDPESEEHAEQACLIPDLIEGWSMGISVGWYDFYWASLADQYVEISGVPDGIYELVSIADGGQTLAETDETDNVASVILRLQGDTATTLETRAFYSNPEE